MIAYEGKEPFAFFSYSHKDTRETTALIVELKSRLYRIWYDEGLTPGESWNDDIAIHLLKCRQFVVFLSPDSVTSKYVLSEISFARSKDKDILPIILKKVELPPAIDFMVSSTQCLDVSDLDLHDKEGFKTAVDKIRFALLRETLAGKNSPFLSDLGYSFYLRANPVEREDADKLPVCEITFKKGNTVKSLFSLKRTKSYEFNVQVSTVDNIKDYFYPGKIIGLYQVNLKVACLLEYPLYGPDFDVIVVLILRIPKQGEPTVKMIDYQYVESVSPISKSLDNDLNSLGENGWSLSVEQYFENKLKEQ